MILINLGLVAGFLFSVPLVGGAATVGRDPCKAIAGKKWVSPAEARACLSATPLTKQIKDNILSVVEKTLDFHASENYQIKAPHPFDDTRVNFRAELDRIKREYYCSEFDFHLDIQRTSKRTNDGHFGVYNHCYDSLYVTYIPLPLVLLNDPRNGSQSVYIAPYAFELTSSMFGKDINFWQNALPGSLKGKLASLSGAKVLKINGRNPLDAVNRNARVAGGYQSFATRQNGFFSSYRRGPRGWQSIMGDFAVKPHPVVDSVELTVKRTNSKRTETFTIPYRSIFNRRDSFRDLKSYRHAHCTAKANTNGHDVYARHTAVNETEPPAIAFFQQQPLLPPHLYDEEPLGVISDPLPLLDIDLPESFWPPRPLPESYSVAQFYMLNDKRTGVLMLGSFSVQDPDDPTILAKRLLQGLRRLKRMGATQLIVDVTNNGGGIICLAHWLHRILMGDTRKTVPQAGLDTTLRAGPLAQKIVDRIVSNNADPKGRLMYNPLRWYNAAYKTFPAHRNWLRRGKQLTINGRKDAFSERMADKCQPFSYGTPPTKRMFEPRNILIASNGRCASSCSLFSIRMAKSHGVRTVVVGGKKGAYQDYCGTVGGQVTHFSNIDTQVKSTKLKGHARAPPDFLTNSAMGVAWRLGYGVNDPNEPEEWQYHYANIRFPLTHDIVNQPFKIWTKLAQEYFKGRVDDEFHVQDPADQPTDLDELEEMEY